MLLAAAFSLQLFYTRANVWRQHGQQRLEQSRPVHGDLTRWTFDSR